LAPKNAGIQTLESPPQESGLLAISKVQLMRLTQSEILGANSAARAIRGEL